MRLRVRLADYAWIVLAQLRAFLAAPDPGSWRSGSGADVLLLPGIWESWAVLRELGDALHRAGHPVHVVPGLGTNSADLDVTARVVADRIVALELHDVVVVAHSKGGLIAKATLPLVADRIAGVVTFATPFEGSRYATWFPAHAVRRLSPRDPALRELAADVSGNARIVALRPRFDPHVPRGAGTPDLAGAVEVELPVDGHFAPLGDPDLHAAVLRAVDGLAARTGGSDPGR